MPPDSHTLVLGIVNNALARTIDADGLAAALRTPAHVAAWREHLLAFFTETPLSRIDSFSAAYGIARSQLRETWDALNRLGPESNPSLDQWLAG